MVCDAWFCNGGPLCLFAVVLLPLTPPQKRSLLQIAHSMLEHSHMERQTLRLADNKTGYFGVSLNKNTQLKPYQARVKCGGKDVHLGCFATAEEAALCVARSPEGQAKERKAVANENAFRGVASITPRFALRRGYIEHARTDVPALATFTVRQSALRAVLP